MRYIYLFFFAEQRLLSHRVCSCPEMSKVLSAQIQLKVLAWVLRCVKKQPKVTKKKKKITEAHVHQIRSDLERGLFNFFLEQAQFRDALSVEGLVRLVGHSLIRPNHPFDTCMCTFNTTHLV